MRMNLGTNLYNARKKSGLSQEEVAEKLGVAGRPYQNGKPTKPCPTSVKPSGWRDSTA